MRKLSPRSAVLLVVVALAAAQLFAQAPAPASPAIDQKVEAILSKMTLEQKIDLLGGINTFDVRAFPEFSLPLLRTADGPIGIRNGGPATVMAGGIALASTWDVDLAEKVGVQIGRDARQGQTFSPRA